MVLYERLSRYGQNQKDFFCTIVKRSGFHLYRTLMVSSLISMVIAFFVIILYLRSFLYEVVH